MYTIVSGMYIESDKGIEWDPKWVLTTHLVIVGFRYTNEFVLHSFVRP